MSDKSDLQDAEGALCALCDWLTSQDIGKPMGVYIMATLIGRMLYDKTAVERNEAIQSINRIMISAARTFKPKKGPRK